MCHQLFGDRFALRLGLALAQHDLEFEEVAEALDTVEVDARLPGQQQQACLAHAADHALSTCQRIAERGAAVGFTFGERKQVWNTFDAHRLLHWAGVEGATGTQHALKKALLQAYHGEGRNPGAHEVLLELAGAVGLDVERARAVLAGSEFGDEVREAERFWQEAGIDGVPAVVVNRRHLIQGGQPPEVFAQALRKIAAEA